MEWTGFAIASWSWAGAVFAWWTFANLAPRAASLRRRYEQEFGEEFTKLPPKTHHPFHLLDRRPRPPITNYEL